MSPLVTSAILAFHTRVARLRLERGDPEGPVVDAWLRAVLPLLGPLSWSLRAPRRAPSSSGRPT
jgi:hypothetical protein